MRAPTKLDTEIGRRLRRARGGAGLTLDETALRLGIDVDLLRHYEMGTWRISSSWLWSIARVLGLPISYFFEGLDPSDLTPANFNRATVPSTDVVSIIVTAAPCPANDNEAAA